VMRDFQNYCGYKVVAMSCKMQTVSGISGAPECEGYVAKMESTISDPAVPITSIVGCVSSEFYLCPRV